ncbi:hypothetical protein J437_LFUL014026 [Ladona fulva]|uniref:Uncharacterized protein n=1 Tax=Ladona fulva TaxID=123851 RepID=A0A8K0KIK8_LADFU|nr:hypothetical protein J437_LFUL014026 [Ladona fulva]
MANHQSQKAISWLTWEDICINHVGNGREARILRRKVDGLHEKTVFEFHGCFFHGCPSCLLNRSESTGDPL